MSSRDKFAPEYRKVIERLIQLRRSAQLTQVQLAERMSIDQSQISKFERCERRMDIIDFIKFCTACGANPSEILDSVPTT